MDVHLALQRCLALAAALWAVAAQAAPGQGALSLQWDPSPSTNVLGYKLYYAPVGSPKTNFVDVGNACSATITGLHVGRTYTFVARAYDDQGLESIPSNECVLTVMIAPPPSGMGRAVVTRNLDSGASIVSFRVSRGLVYQVQATDDFTAWVTLDTISTTWNGVYQYQDTRAFPYCFYRVMVSPRPNPGRALNRDDRGS